MELIERLLFGSESLWGGGVAHSVLILALVVALGVMLGKLKVVPEDYAVKIRRIFTEKYGKSAIPRNKRRQQMGEFNMEYVKKYSMEVVDKQMRKIYADLLGGEN